MEDDEEENNNLRDSIAEQLKFFDVRLSDTMLDAFESIGILYKILAQPLADNWLAFCANNRIDKQDVNESTLRRFRKHLDRELQECRTQAMSAPIFKEETVVDLPKTDTSELTPVKSRAPPPGERVEMSPIVRRAPAAKYVSKSKGLESPLFLSRFSNLSTESKWDQHQPARDVRIRPFNEESFLRRTYLYQFQRLSDVRDVQASRMEELQYEYIDNGVIDSFCSPVAAIGEKSAIFGRIMPETSEESGSDATKCKLTLRNLAIETSDCPPPSVCKPLRFADNATSLSCFPGRLIALHGSSPAGRTFVVSEATEIPLAPQAKFDVDALHSGGGSLKLLVAAGPYTATDSILYEPLADLAKEIVKMKPDVAILMGPFVSRHQANIEEMGLCTDPGPFTFREQFDYQIMRLLVTVSEAEDVRTKIVLIPSIADAHHQPIYPCPPYEFSNELLSVPEAQNLILAPEPAVLNINGVVIAVSSTDVLFQLCRNEVMVGDGTPSINRLARCMRHVLRQRSFYPLYPPPINIEYEHMPAHGYLDTRPHLLLTASDMHGFIKELDDCLTVNVHRLVTGQVAGTYCRIVVAVPESERASPNFLKCVDAELIRI